MKRDNVTKDEGRRTKDDKGNEQYKRILIVEVNWLGDVLFSTPFIRAMRGKFKDAHIACMIPPRAREALEYNPCVNELIIYDEKNTHKSLLGKIRFISQLREKHFDIAILLHRSLTRTLMAIAGGIGERAGYATKKRRPFLTRPISPPACPAGRPACPAGRPGRELHKVEYFLNIAKSFGCGVSEKDYEFFITDKEKSYIEEELRKNGVAKEDFLVVINPGGNWLPKRWSEDNFAGLSDILIRKYGVKVAASGAEKDKALISRIKNKMEENLIDLSGRTNLKELGALMERANCVISGDSGPMHIAVAMKSFVIALFGPTSPGLTGPYGSGNYAVIQKNIGCKIPCYNLTCNNYKCMDAITVEDVLKVFKGRNEGNR